MNKNPKYPETPDEIKDLLNYVNFSLFDRQAMADKHLVHLNTIRNIISGTATLNRRNIKILEDLVCTASSKLKIDILVSKKHIQFTKSQTFKSFINYEFSN